MSNFIKGNANILSVYNSDTSSYIPISCLTSNSLAETRNIIESQTKCNQESLGTNLVTNGNFDTDTDWTKGAGWTIGGGVAHTDGTISELSQILLIDEGLNYKLTIETSNGNYVDSLSIIISAVALPFSIISDGSHDYYFTAPSGDGRLSMKSRDLLGGCICDVDNVILKRVIITGGIIIKDSGSYNYELSLEGQTIDTPILAATEASHNFLHSIMISTVGLIWRLSTGLTDKPYYYGTGFLSDLSLDAASGDEISTFSGTIVGSGIVLDTGSGLNI